MRCVNCRWYHNENEVCLKDGCSVFNPSADDPCEYADNMTLFARITASPEVLAEEFVEIMFNPQFGDYQSFSMLTYEFYETRAEAITATVAKLKEVIND